MIVFHYSYSRHQFYTSCFRVVWLCAREPLVWKLKSVLDRLIFDCSRLPLYVCGHPAFNATQLYWKTVALRFCLWYFGILSNDPGFAPKTLPSLRPPCSLLIIWLLARAAVCSCIWVLIEEWSDMDPLAYLSCLDVVVADTSGDLATLFNCRNLEGQIHFSDDAFLSLKIKRGPHRLA